MNDFHVGAGSVLGRRHLEQGLNNQDALALFQSPELLVAIVCDGCSGGNLSFDLDSEIGAKLQATSLVRNIVRFYTASDTPMEVPVALEAARAMWLNAVITMASTLQEPLQDFITTKMMATVVGVVMTPETTTLFRKGDGIYQVNEEDPVLIDEENQPSYPVYALLNVGENSGFVIERVMPTVEVNGLILATDGALPFVVTPQRLAHGDKPLGSLSQFYDPLWMEHPTNIRRRLIACGPWRGRRPAQNPLDDDCSIIRIQRKPSEETEEPEEAS